MQKTKLDYENKKEKNIYNGEPIGHATITCYAVTGREFAMVWYPDDNLSEALKSATEDSLIKVTKAEPSSNSYEVITTTVKRVMTHFNVGKNMSFTELGKPIKTCITHIPYVHNENEEELTISNNAINSSYVYSDFLVYYFGSVLENGN